MKVLLVGNIHLVKNKEGDYYSPSIYSYDFLKRYLNVFDEVRLIGKVKAVDEIDKSKLNLVSGAHVEILELPWYQGARQMVFTFGKCLPVYKKACKQCDCYIFRVAQVESFFTYYFGRKKGVPYIVEVVNDPETFPISKIAKKITTFLLKKMTISANGASYVTERFLQKKYPNKLPNKKSTEMHYETYYSSVEIEDDEISTKPITYCQNEIFKIVHVANAINGDIKGHYALINAVDIVKKSGRKVKVCCIGDGTKIDEYRKYVQKLGLEHEVEFRGRISDRKKIFDILRSSNLMVLPTRMEGLPRTIIEAMAVGLPCISTPVAGIPELLDEKYLFDPDDYKGFANEIIRLMDSPEELFRMSRDNIEKAKQFSKTKLEIRRTWLYEKLKEDVLRKE